MAITSISINVGDLKQVVEIQRNTPTTGDSGFQEDNWATYLKTRAKMEFDDRLMREVFRNEGIDSSVVSIFTIRYFEGLSIKDRILFKGNGYDISGIDNIGEANRYYRIWARKLYL